MGATLNFRRKPKEEEGGWVGYNLDLILSDIFCKYSDIEQVDEDYDLDFLKGVLEGLKMAESEKRDNESIRVLTFILDEIAKGETIEFWKEH